MNWWMNFYLAEGPGIPKDAPPATGLRLFGQTLAREWWNLILLNLIFLAAALPLVTLPAAIVSLLHVTARMAEDQPCEPWRDFRDMFLAEFWRATLGGLLIGGALAIGCGAAVAYARAAQETLIYAAPLAIALAVTGLGAVFAVYLCQLIANAGAGIRYLARAAALATLLRPLPVLAALGGNLALWLIHIAAYPSSILLAVTLNFSLGALFLSFGARRAAAAAIEHVTRPDDNDQRQFPPGQTRRPDFADGG